MTPDLLKWVMICADSDEFVEQYCRLTGERFARSALEKMIDDATGNTRSAQAERFIDFCRWVIHTRTQRPTTGGLNERGD